MNTITSTKTNPLGVLIIGRKRPGFDQQWNEIIRKRSLEALQSLDLPTVGADTPVVDDQTTIAKLQQIRQAGADALLVLQPSLGNGQLCLTVSQQWDGPIILWATPERPEGPKVSSCSLVAQHLWASILRQAQHPFEFIYGDPGDADLRHSLRRAVNLCRTTAKLRTSKIGLVGAQAPGFLAMQPDLFLMRRQIGTQLHPLSLIQFVDRVRAQPEDDVRKDVQRVAAMGLPLRDVTADDLAVNSRYYLAMLDLMKEEALDGLAVQCWPELPNVMGQWPYLAFARLTDEGHIISLEGDADAALTCLAARHLGAGVGYITDWLEHDDRTITLWHAGNAPLQLCCPPGAENGACLAPHFNINKPLVLDAVLKPDQPVTLARFWRCDDQYHVTAFQGRTLPPHRRLAGNTALVELPSPGLRNFFDDLLHAGLPHHVVMFQGHHQETFRRLTRLLKLDWLQPPM